MARAVPSLDAEAHFLAIAARNLLRALDAWGEMYEVPDLDLDLVRKLRDRLEHFDDPSGRAAAWWSQLAASGMTTGAPQSVS